MIYTETVSVVLSEFVSPASNEPSGRSIFMVMQRIGAKAETAHQIWCSMHPFVFPSNIVVSEFYLSF